MDKNREIWDKVKHTNPRWTKPFGKFGKPLTAIDPMYQVMVMTDTFGPVGKGWNYKVSYTYTPTLVFAEVSVAHNKIFNDSTEWVSWDWYGPVSSVQALTKKNGGLDDEAPKKAMTDALTKAFSHLGVSADVFLGMFDNSKYVEDMKEKFSQKPKVADEKLVKFNK
ncbi:uncharacterized protein METZ01_LOCUS156267 [marine metagenome]|uniref:Rad52/22 double-strand break repair protein n=1 Tax=marine metagenome TaxID=408172 RepID=A0A382AQV0_9ZZZZ